jgi:hypothetical protein
MGAPKVILGPEFSDHSKRFPDHSGGPQPRKPRGLCP